MSAYFAARRFLPLIQPKLQSFAEFRRDYCAIHRLPQPYSIDYRMADNRQSSLADIRRSAVLDYITMHDLPVLFHRCCIVYYGISSCYRSLYNLSYLTSPLSSATMRLRDFPLCPSRLLPQSGRSFFALDRSRRLRPYVPSHHQRHACPAHQGDHRQRRIY